MIYQLPPKYALILRGGLAPVIAHAPIGWHDLGYPLARLRGQAVAPVRGAGPGGAAQHRARPCRQWTNGRRWTPRQRPAARGRGQQARAAGAAALGRASGRQRHQR
jgi:hypothetical protein